jgi:hypothetical protein
VIVLDAGATQRLITQPDHAALASRIMQVWKADGLPAAPRRSLILHAVEQHDNGWIEVDSAPIVDATTGRIADFMSAPVEIRRSVWPRGVRRLAADPWAAALVAEHAMHIYARYEDEPSWVPFFDEMRRLRLTCADEAGLGLDTLVRDYFFLRIGDLISLVFCNHWTETQEFGAYTIRWEPPALYVTPDPFAGGSMSIAVSAVEIPNRPFRDDADGLAAWRSGREVTVNGRLTGQR